MAIALMTLALVTAGNWDGATAYSNVSQPHTTRKPHQCWRGFNALL